LDLERPSALLAFGRFARRSFHFGAEFLFYACRQRRLLFCFLFITWNKSPEALTLLLKALLERQKRPAAVASVAGNLFFDVIRGARGYWIDAPSDY
jgi:hypothetical protein